MQTGQPGSAPTPESSHSESVNLNQIPGPLHELERYLHVEQERLQKYNTPGYLPDSVRPRYVNALEKEIAATKRSIAKHPDSQRFDSSSVYNQNKKDYYPGMSFSPEQKALIDRIVKKMDGPHFKYEASVWNDKSTASDIEIVNTIRDIIQMGNFDKKMNISRDHKVEAEDIEEFNRLFPKDRSEELFLKIKDLERKMAVDRHMGSEFGNEEDKQARKRELRELTQQLMDDLKQHLVD